VLAKLMLTKQALYLRKMNLQSIFLWMFGNRLSQTISLRLTSNLDPPDLRLRVARIIGMSHQHPVYSDFYSSSLRDRFYFVGQAGSELVSSDPPASDLQVAETIDVHHHVGCDDFFIAHLYTV
jgi:hypothetical protein